MLIPCCTTIPGKVKTSWNFVFEDQVRVNELRFFSAEKFEPEPFVVDGRGSTSRSVASLSTASGSSLGSTRIRRKEKAWNGKLKPREWVCEREKERKKESVCACLCLWEWEDDWYLCEKDRRRKGSRLMKRKNEWMNEKEGEREKERKKNVWWRQKRRIREKRLKLDWAH